MSGLSSQMKVRKRNSAAQGASALLLLSILLALILAFQMLFLSSVLILAGTALLLLLWFLLKKLMYRMSKSAGVYPIILLVLLLAGGICFISIYSFIAYRNVYNRLEACSEGGDQETHAISLVVMKDQGYEELKELEGKTIAVYPGTEQQYTAAFMGELESQIHTDYYEADSLEDLIDSIYMGKADGAIVPEAYREVLAQWRVTMIRKTKVLTVSEYPVDRVISKREKSVDINDGIFTIFISAVDSPASASVRTSSIFNAMLLVNSNTREVIFIKVPGSMLAKLDSNKELDRMMDTGIYGLNESIGAIGRKLQTDINYYARISLNDLADLIDQIGGIEVEAEEAVFPSSDRTVHITEGMNHMNGRMAIAYMREINAYSTGIAQTNQNQLNVIKGVISRLFSNEVLRARGVNVLSDAAGCITTNMSANDMMLCIKTIILSGFTNKKWDYREQFVSGRMDESSTYSIQSRTPAVIAQDDEEIVTLQEELNAFLGEERILK